MLENHSFIIPREPGCGLHCTLPPFGVFLKLLPTPQFTVNYLINTNVITASQLTGATKR